MRCQTTLLKVEYVKIDIDGLDFELRKKCEGMAYLDLFELPERAYESLLRLKRGKSKKNFTFGTYY
jgi:hypothetical protein